MSRKTSAGPGPGPGMDPQITFQRAVTEYEAGRYEQAHKFLKPLRESPDPNGYITLLSGLVEAELGEWKKAESLLADAVKVLPQRVEGWMGLGNAQRVLGDARAAVASYRRALDLQPRLASGWNNLGLAYSDLRCDHDALHSFERALEIVPRYREAAESRAETLVRLTRFDAARSAYQALMDTYPDDVEIPLAYAETMEKANRGDLAEQLLPPRERIRQPELLARREVLRARLLAREEKVDEALEVARAARSQTGAEWIGYLEGDLLDRKGQADDAMEAFTRANGARAGQWSFRRLRDQQLLEFLEHKISRGIESPAGTDANVPSDAKTPTFIIGLPRSGTTLLDRILAAHPGVQVLEEPESLHVIQAVLSKGASLEEVRRRYWEYLETIVGIEPDRVIVDKHPFHAFHIDLLPQVFPNANVIYSLRHPFDSALSCFMQDFAPNPATIHFLDIESTAKLCARSLRMMEMYERACPDRVHRLRYESLVSGDLRGELESLLDAIGLEWHREMEHYAEKASRSGLIKTASYEQVTRGLYTTAVERWRRYERWLEPFREHLGGSLEYWGYEG